MLCRHGRTTANASGTLAGRLPGTRLDEVGEGQAARAGERLAQVPLVALVSSPMERCQQTAAALNAARAEPLDVVVDPGLDECDYGDWQGRPLKELAKEPLWRTVQGQPSAVVFPGGESLRDMQRRAVEAVRRRDAEVAAEHGPGAVWVAVTHGDIVKALLADALGMHLDLFQRLHADPASLSVIRYTDSHPFVVQANSHAGPLDWLRPPPPAADGVGPDTAGSPDEAAVGGGAGPAPAAG